MSEKFLPSITVPQELQGYHSFVVWGKGGSFCKIPYSPYTGQPASTTNPRDWASYLEASEYAHNNGFSGIGFVLSEADPFAFIDLDDCEGNQDLIDQQMGVFETFKSYSEQSPSGKGLHIIVKGSLPKGRRRNKVEIYSSGRYMTMSGKPYRNIPIISCQQNLTNLYKALGGREQATQILDGDSPEVHSDEEIFEKARSAVNGEKFLDLWEGNFSHWYPPPKGHSEADFALIDILAFYTPSRTQIIRMFHASELGQRKKAKRKDYCDYMLNRCFDRYLPAVDLSFLKDKILARVGELSQISENPKLLKSDKILKNAYKFPPGLIGEIATFILQQSPRPVPEISLIASLGLMSAIVGRCYNVSSTGLNQYYLLLAPTGIGKEAIELGLGKIISMISKKVRGAENFLGPGAIASPQGLIKHMSAGGPKSFACVIGEFGIELGAMSGPKAPANKVGVKRLLLDLYNKSGPHSELRPTVYSDATKNTDVIKSPAVTIIGESTLTKFYENLDEDMIAEGLLPRFLTIEYTGKRPKMNHEHGSVYPSEILLEAISSLCAHCVDMNFSGKTVDVQFSPEGNRLLAEFNDLCDHRINSSQDDVIRQLWNRAHLKALKISALVAIGINPYNPVICEEAANWAKAIVVRDCSNISTKFREGAVGSGTSELLQQSTMRELFVRFTTEPYQVFAKTLDGVPNAQTYHSDKVIPYSFIQRRCVGLKCFRLDRRGPTAAIKQTLRTLLEIDDIGEISLKDREIKYGSRAAAYILKNTREIKALR